MSDAIQKYVAPAGALGMGTLMTAEGMPWGIPLAAGGLGGLIGSATGGSKGELAGGLTGAGAGTTLAAGTSGNSGNGILGAVQALAPLAGQGMKMMGPQGQGQQPQAMPKGAPSSAMAPPTAPPRTPVAGTATTPTIGPAASNPGVARPAGQPNSLTAYANFLRQIGAA